MFGKPVDRGLCFFQAVLVPDEATARASLGQIRTAASNLILRTYISELIHPDWH